MKKLILSSFSALCLFSTGIMAQLIPGDVNKPVNQVYKLAAVNYGTPQEPVFTVTAPTACSGAGSTGSVTISWPSGTTAASIRYFSMHNAMDFNGNLLYPCNPTPCSPAARILNNANAFTTTYSNLAPGIYTFGINRDPNDDNLTTNQPTPANNVFNDYTIGGWNDVAGDQTRCAVVGVIILPVNSNNLTTCTIAYTNASNCTSANGSVTISGLAPNTSYETSHLVNGAWSSAVNSGATGTITINNLLTGIYPVRIRRQGEICYRQFNIKVGNNSGIECFADNQLLDPALGTSLVTGGNFGVNAGALPLNGTTDYTLVPGGFAMDNPGDSRYVLDDTTDLQANGINVTTQYNYRLRNMSYSTFRRHLWSCFQLTGDHTGSNDQNNGNTGNTLGYTMIVNANYRTDRVINISNIGLTAGRSYVFSFWAKNLQPFMPRNKNNGTSLNQTYQPIIPRLALAVDGIIYDFAEMTATLEPASFNAATLLNQMGWEQYNLRLIAPVTNANANITIYNFQQGGFGNDFAIDDIQFLALSVIGDRIWNDLDRDGVQDINEPGMANVTATLLDAGDQPLQTTVSDAFGYYQFANIAPAAGGTSYKVKFTLPAGYTFSPQTGGGGAGNATDSDPNTTTGTTAAFTLLVGESEMDIDCGLVFDQPQLPSSIGDYVWFDADADGVQDAGESGLANVTIMLYNNAGNIVSTTVTNANGYYRFDNVAPGNYRIGITQPAGTICTGKDLGGNDNTDSDINNSGVNIRKTDIIVVPANTQITHVDIGLALMPLTSSSFGDLCWNDLDQDGLQDASEPGLPNVKVVLCRPGPDNLANTADDIRVDSVFTDAFGKWQFTSLTFSAYFVRFTPPAGYTYTLRDVGSDDAIDSDVLSPGISGVIGINNSPSGFNYEILDVGFYLTTPVANAGTVSDFFWNDINGNGVQETGEFGVPGITVELRNNAGTVVATTTTNWSGNYIFTNIPPAAGYTVRFSNIPPGFQVTLRDQGANDNTDSDIDMATGISNSFTLANNQAISNIDGGIRQVMFTGNSSVGSLVWYDLDNDGVQDPNETGVPNITVTLRDAGADGTMLTADDITRVSTTNSIGQFMFNALPQGLYRVEFSALPAIGFTLSTKDAGGNDDADSDGNPVTLGISVTDNFRLLFGEDKVNLALGIVPDNTVRRIGNRVWADDNGNGLQDAGENDGVQSVVIQLLDGSGNLIDKDAVTPGIQPWQTVSNASGFWHIVDIPNGTYIPRFSYLPPGFRLSPTKNGGNNTIDSDVQGNGRSAIAVTINNGQRVNNDVDLGLVPQSAVLGDFVWDDLNGNGLQDAAEPGIVSVTATIY
ncbi:MAG: carboxypeptidase regulatory-like domain-containing protein, partial [Dinghuibacter sp.]|nr:carboxypeptidase regulatory-like domain-containing protein [Dinghuibacter sp.]